MYMFIYLLTLGLAHIQCLPTLGQALYIDLCARLEIPITVRYRNEADVKDLRDTLADLNKIFGQR